MAQNNTAILLTSYQNETVSEGGKLNDAVKEFMRDFNMAANVKQILVEARKKGCLVIHSPMSLPKDFVSKHEHLNGCFEPDSWGAEFPKDCQPEDTDTILTPRTGYNAFKETKLQSILEEDKIDTLYIFGFMTNNAVAESVIAATEIFPDMQVVVVEDACADQVESRHQHATLALLPMYCDVFSTYEAVKLIRRLDRKERTKPKSSVITNEDDSGYNEFLNILENDELVTKSSETPEVNNANESETSTKDDQGYDSFLNKLMA